MTRVQQMSENAWLTIVGRFTVLLGVPIIIILIGWQLTKQDGVQESIAKLTTKIAVLESKLDTAASDQYHGVDAKRDFRYRDDQMKGMENHIENLDGRLQALELQSARRH